MLEQVVETYTARDVRLDVSGFAEGMYLVYLIDGGQVYAREKVGDRALSWVALYDRQLRQHQKLQTQNSPG